MEEALVQNQGAIIEPLYLATSQAYRDADELEAALAYLIPTWCYTQDRQPDDLLPGVDAGPARGLSDGLGHVLPRDGVGDVGHRRRPSIPSSSNRRTVRNG